LCGLLVLLCFPVHVPEAGGPKKLGLIATLKLGLLAGFAISLLLILMRLPPNSAFYYPSPLLFFYPPRPPRGTREQLGLVNATQKLLREMRAAMEGGHEEDYQQRLPEALKVCLERIFMTL
jgi:hypothetical protein